MTHPPSGPSTPPPPSGPKVPSGPLDSITLLLRTCQLVADRRLAGADPAARMRLDYALDSARRAVADLQSPARRGHTATAVNLVSTPGGPVPTTRLQAGERLAPGYGAAISSAVTESDGAVVAPIAGAYLPAGRPPLPGGGFTLPRPPDFEIGVGPLYDALPRSR